MGFLERIMGIQTTPDLRECEQVIQRHLDSYREAGTALKTIRDGRLYRRVAETFEAYLEQRWKMQVAQANRLIAAAEVAANLAPLGAVPKNESTARPLTPLNLNDRIDVWNDAKAAAAPAEPTSKHVREAIEKRRPRSAKRRPKAFRFKVPGALVLVEPGKGFLGAEESLFEALRKCGAAIERIPVKDAA